MSGDLLLEFGCEELPARLLEAQARLLFDGLKAQLDDAGIGYQSEGSRWFATPRRLAVLINDVAAGQPDRTLDRKGPAVSAAFDADGKPTRAAEGFARSVGKSVEQLEKLETKDGAWLFARVEQPGQPLAALLPGMLEKVVGSMTGSRSMRWSDRSERFLRPVRWLLALHGDEVLPLSLFGLDAGRFTRGHRIHDPGPHEIARPADYHAALSSARVIADPATRREEIEQQVRAAAQEAGLEARIDDSLLHEVANLTEWPRAVTGRFEREFLEVPAEALIASMQHHQKFFPLFDAPQLDTNARLANTFVAVANIDSEDVAAMRHGFERVIRPRLADARFFWDQDLQKSLEKHAQGLDGVVFQQKLGTLADKTDRVSSIVKGIADVLGQDPTPVTRAAALCKADLLTEMVGEFPELQGIMGRYYALESGQDGAVADAIESHYRPRFAGDELPADDSGRMLALADRLDTLLGVFAAGQKPKGGKDPFALRRAALGVVRLLIESRWTLELGGLLRNVVTPPLSKKVQVTDEIIGEVEAFVMDRLKSYLSDQGAGSNVFAAVNAGRMGTLADFANRAQAVRDFAAMPEAETLIAANKRIQNILKQADSESFGEVDDKSLQEDEELALLKALQEAERAIEPLRAKVDYPGILKVLAGLRAPVDAFFDRVLVMCDDESLRRNRLALLARLRQLVADVADVALLGI